MVNVSDVKVSIRRNWIAFELQENRENDNRIWTDRDMREIGHAWAMGVEGKLEAAGYQAVVSLGYEKDHWACNVYAYVEGVCFWPTSNLDNTPVFLEEKLEGRLDEMANEAEEEGRDFDSAAKRAEMLAAARKGLDAADRAMAT